MTTKQLTNQGENDWAKFPAGTELPLGMVVYQGLLLEYYTFLEMKYPGYHSDISSFPKPLASDAAFGDIPTMALAESLDRP